MAYRRHAQNQDHETGQAKWNRDYATLAEAGLVGALSAFFPFVGIIVAVLACVHLITSHYGHNHGICCIGAQGLRWIAGTPMRWLMS